jgi:hypothetical protein
MDLPVGLQVTREVERKVGRKKLQLDRVLADLGPVRRARRRGSS